MAKAPKFGEKICPHCREHIKIDARICKHCKSEFSADEIKEATKQQATGLRNAGFGCLVVVLIIGACVSIIGGDGTGSVPEKPGPTAKADVIAFYKSAISVVAPCDKAGKALAAATETGDMVTVYQGAEFVKSMCLSTPSDIRALKVPVSVGREAHGELTKAIDTCHEAYLSRWAAAGALKDALDDPSSLAGQAKLREATSSVQAGSIACAASLVGPAMGLGATAADLKV